MILTLNGWERYNKDVIESPVLCYNVELNQLEWHKPTNEIEYTNQHTAYRIESDFTDQIVSREHRCLIERKGKLLFNRAETLESKENIPFLESLPTLQQTISSTNKGTGNAQQNLLKRMCGGSKFIEQKRQVKANRSVKKDTGKLCGMQERIRAVRLLSKEDKKTNLLTTVQWKVTRSRLERTRSQRTCELDT